MSDIALTALISTGGATLVAIAGAVAAIFGPAWRDRAARKLEREAAAETARYEALLGYIEALNAITPVSSNLVRYRDAHLALSRFVSTLRPGEGPAGDVARGLLQVREKSVYGLDEVQAVSERLFAWLRGEISVTEI